MSFLNHLSHQPKKHSLDAFRACLAGEFDRISDWSDVVMHANEHLIGPELHRRLRTQTSPSIDSEALAYFEDQDFANQERNQRIVAQLKELIAVLTAAGITAVLIKGASVLAKASAPSMVSRISSDVDIVVLQDDREKAEVALHELGYEAMPGTVWGHSTGSFARQDVVAAIDLHFQLPTAIETVVPLGEIFQRGQEIELGQGARVIVPNRDQQILLNIAHEMLHDRHLAKGFTNFRYLIELENLLADSPADGGSLAQTVKGSPRLEMAFEVQDRMAHRFLSKRLFPWVTYTRRGQLLHIRRMLKLRFARLGQWEWAAIVSLRKKRI